jgi:hypothetical protein
MEHGSISTSTSGSSSRTRRFSEGGRPAHTWRGDWSWGEDPDGWDAVALGELDAWSWRAGVRVGIDWGLAAILLRVGATDPRNVSARGFGELALRIWPDAAPP